MTKNIIAEFGDFQTPFNLCNRVCSLLARKGFAPSSIIEPTCGIGGFLEASSSHWPKASLLGIDINAEYIQEAKRRLNGKAVVLQGDFFTFDWHKYLDSMPHPLLFVGNLPWVTNAKVGSIGGSNLPIKNNFQGHKGFDAITGKSNFDISEWMLIAILTWFKDKQISFALLCKTAVARKALFHAWKHSINIRSAIHRIDAKIEFNVSVDACLLVVESSNNQSYECPVFEDLEAAKPIQTIGYREQHLIADVPAYDKCHHLIGESPYQWRSGIKHDCSKVMELTEDENGKLVNGLDEIVEIESTYLFPMLKSSCIANGRHVMPRKWMLVTQRKVNEPTDDIAKVAPKTWQYLMKHRALLDKRGSSIYKNRPPFSIFGIGAYSFTLWKVSISGFYHGLEFRLVKSYHGKPIVLDDTINFLPCKSEKGAMAFMKILNSDTAKQFFNAFIFWDNKRPITTEILHKLNLSELAKELRVTIPAIELEE